MRRIRRAGLAVSALATAAVLAACTGQGRTGAAPPGGAEVNEAAEERGTFTVVATGDVIPYPSIMEQAKKDAGGDGYDFRRIFAGVKPVVAPADLAICHVETPYGPPEGPFTGYPMFQSPPQVAAGLRATGYDSCSTASNHTLDGGFEGLSRTLDALDKAGIRHAGSARTAEEARRPARLSAGGADVAHLSYTYGTNGVPVPEGREWAVSMLDPDRVTADARAARRAGADVVIVSVHWGTEWQREPDADQLAVAERLTAARTGGRPDIDLVIGTHNHVPQAYEKVNGVWVVYGLGDQVASFVPPGKRRGNEGSMARFTFAPEGGRWTVEKAEFVVGHSDMGPPFRVVTATADRFPEVRDRVREAVLSRGAAGDGLTEGR